MEEHELPEQFEVIISNNPKSLEAAIETTRYGRPGIWKPICYFQVISGRHTTLNVYSSETFHGGNNYHIGQLAGAVVQDLQRAQEDGRARYPEQPTERHVRGWKITKTRSDKEQLFIVATPAWIAPEHSHGR